MLTGGSGTGLDPRVAGALCYLLSVVTGIFFLFMEKNSRFVRFHAWQSILLFITYLGLYTVAQIVGDILSVLPLIGEPLWFAAQLFNQALSLGMGVITILLMVKAYREETFMLPFLGSVAERNAYS